MDVLNRVSLSSHFFLPSMKTLPHLLRFFGVLSSAAMLVSGAFAQDTTTGDANAARGKVAMCIGCHGATLSGGKIPGGPPDWPAAANITPGDKSVMPAYKDATTFATMMKTGKRPDGSAIKVMPFESLREMNDIDVQALYAYLKTVPAKPFGQR